MSLEPQHGDSSSDSNMNLASSSSSSSSNSDEFVVYDRDLLLHLSTSPRVQQAQGSLPLAPLKQWYSELLADPNHAAQNANYHQGGAGRESGHHPRQNRRARNDDHEGNNHHHRGLQPMGDFRAEGARPRRGHQQQQPSLTNISASLTSPPPPQPPSQSQAAVSDDNNNNGTAAKSMRRPNNPTSRSDTGPWRPSRLQQAQQQHRAAEEHQPAWMADSSLNDAPGSSTEPSPAWMSFPADAKKDAGLPIDKGGHIDEIQAFKAQMRERERREKGLPPSSADTPAPPSTSAGPLDDPAIFSHTRPAAQDAILPAAMSVAAAETAHRDALMDAAPRGSRFARLFNKQPEPSLAAPPQPQPQPESAATKPSQSGGHGDDDVKGFMSALLNNKPQHQTGAPPSASLGLGSAPSPSSSSKAAAAPPVPVQAPQGQAGDSDMARVMQMLQSSVALSPDPSASARASPVSSFEQPRQSRHAFARGGGSSAGASTRATPQPQQQPSSVPPPPPPPGMLNDPAIMSQQRPTPTASAQSSRRQPSMHARDFVMNPSASPNNMDPLMSMMMSNASGAAPPRSVAGGPHSLPGLMSLSGPPASSSTPAAAAAASSGSMGAPPRFAQASSAPNGVGMSAGEPAPPRMQQQQQQQHFPGGFGMPPPRQPGFPGAAPHLPGAGPPGPPSRGGSMSSPMNMYDMSSMGFIPPGLPGAAGIPPPAPQQQRGMPPPPPPPQMMPPFPPYSMQHPPPPGALQGMNLPPMHQHMMGRGGAAGGGAGPSASPDLMALFAAHSGGGAGGGVSASPAQFR